MSQPTHGTNSQSIILTTGVYDLIKDHIRKKKVSPHEEEILALQLKKAQQVTRKNLPENIVTVDARVTIKDRATEQVECFVFVAPDKVKKKHKTESILSTIGLAVVGCREGDIIHWPFEGQDKQLEIVKVERLA